MKNPFKDKDGRVVVAQKPNWQLAGAIIARLVQFVAPEGSPQSAAKTLYILFLIFWAYEELVNGANYFRRALGLSVLIATFLSVYSLLS